MNYKHILSLALGLGLAASATAQGRIMNVLEATPDARAAAMGHNLMGASRGMYLYTNPASMVLGQEKLNIGLSGELYPDSPEGRLRQYSFSAGYRLGRSSALMGGVRYLGGLRLPTTNGLELGAEALRPHECTIDLGYALAITPHLVVHLAGSYLHSDMGTKASGLALSAGVGYQRSFALGSKQTTLNLGARLLDLGQSMRYDDTKLPQPIPTSLALGGNWALELAPQHQLTYGLSGRFFLTEGSKEQLIGTGIEYGYDHLVFARLGYQYSRYGADRLTMGLGCAWRGLKLDATYSHSSPIYGVDTFSLGLGFSL